MGYLNNGVSISMINHTNVVLIPKQQAPNTTKDFKPISFFNEVYKIISKFLEDRMKSILTDIIDESQKINSTDIQKQKINSRYRKECV